MDFQQYIQTHFHFISLQKHFSAVYQTKFLSKQQKIISLPINRTPYGSWDKAYDNHISLFYNVEMCWKIFLL
jgi:hypothetical protein